jgi:hypothetical protein
MHVREATHVFVGIIQAYSSSLPDCIDLDKALWLSHLGALNHSDRSGTIGHAGAGGFSLSTASRSVYLCFSPFIANWPESVAFQ